MVEKVGIEPTKTELADLQSAGINHSPTSPNWLARRGTIPYNGLARHHVCMCVYRFLVKMVLVRSSYMRIK